ncbi:hypothetical protein IT411_04165 [Candidatus Peregrinibacteria bacterium]|nr:hypothetical protein [Candidatus Peregrinibacteria bacterium]
MSMKEIKENIDFDWATAFFDHEAAKKTDSRRDVSPDEVAREFRTYQAIKKILSAKDEFTPSAINQFNSADLPLLWDLSMQFGAMSAALPIYGRYKQIIDKLLVLIYTEMPDEISTLSESRKDDLFGMKMSLPTEKSLYGAVYIFSLRHQPDDMQGTGVSFEDAVAIRQSAQAKKNPAFLKKILAANDDYKRYFIEKKREQDSSRAARV